jgi:uncharacterized protein (DUF362 family)
MPVRLISKSYALTFLTFIFATSISPKSALPASDSSRMGDQHMLVFIGNSENRSLQFGNVEEPMASRSGITRREILGGAAGAAAAAGLGGLAGCFTGAEGTWPDASPDAFSTCGCSPPDGGSAATSAQDQRAPVQGASTVVTIQRDDSIDALGISLDQPYLDVVQSMVDSVLSALAGGAANPWSVILPTAGSCTRIGLKVNCLNTFFATSPAIVRAIIKNLVTNAGVCPGNIIVWDRRLDELTRAGRYTDEHLQGAQLVGTVNSTEDLHGPGYSRELFGTFQGYAPRLSRILTDHTDLTINCPVLKTHGQSGVTAALKNIYGVINIPGTYHTDSKTKTDLQTALPALYNIPRIRDSIKLTIVDALRAVTLGDTADRPDRFPGRIFASMDPLALDHYALDVVNQLRAARNQGPVSPAIVSWLDNAYQLGLGTKDYKLVTPTAPADGGATGDDGAAGDDDAASADI